mgnify:CR=1 FL=1
MTSECDNDHDDDDYSYDYDKDDYYDDDIDSID